MQKELERLAKEKDAAANAAARVETARTALAERIGLELIKSVGDERAASLASLVGKAARKASSEAVTEALSRLAGEAKPRSEKVPPDAASQATEGA